MAAAVDCFGGLQILVNNAGVGVFANVADTSDEDWDAVIGTNLTAVFRLTRAALPHLTHRGGHVFMVSSLAGKNPIAGLAAYCASKAALDQFAACLMLEVRHQGVKVTTIAPGSVDTAFAGAAAPGRHVLDAHAPRTWPRRSSTCCGCATGPTRAAWRCGRPSPRSGRRGRPGSSCRLGSRTGALPTSLLSGTYAWLSLEAVTAALPPRWRR